MDLPGRIRHDDPELAEDGHVKRADVTVDPLQRGGGGGAEGKKGGSVSIERTMWDPL